MHWLKWILLYFLSPGEYYTELKLNEEKKNGRNNNCANDGLLNYMQIPTKITNQKNFVFAFGGPNWERETHAPPPPSTNPTRWTALCVEGIGGFGLGHYNLKSYFKQKLVWNSLAPLCKYDAGTQLTTIDSGLQFVA